MLHREHPLFRFLEQERAHLGQSRAGYVRWLLEQQFLRAQGAITGAASLPPVRVASSIVADEIVRTVSPPEPPALETDDDLLASFLA